MIFGAFDIGLYNTAFYVEEFDESLLSKIKNIPKTKRYDSNKECTEPFKNLLQQIYNNGKCMDLFKVSFNDTKKKFVGLNTLNNINTFIKQNENYFKQCKVIIIEKQLKQNNIACRIEHHLESILNYCYPDIKILLFPSKNKTIINGAPYKLLNKKGILTKMSKYQRKKWSYNLAKNILETRNDKKGLELIMSEDKKDDLADTITELQAAKYLFFVDKKYKL